MKCYHGSPRREPHEFDPEKCPLTQSAGWVASARYAPDDIEHGTPTHHTTEEER